jgi:uncharacterized delta-60 repeat protein
MKRGRGLGVLTPALVALLCATALGAPADLDPTFGDNGVRRLNYGGVESGSAAVLQPDGKVVIVGTGVEDTFAVTRLNRDGSLDTSFAGDGARPIFFDVPSGAAYAVALTPDGRIVVAGTSGGNIAVARLTPDGELDSSFDGDGKRVIDYGGPYEGAYGMALQPDGKIVLAGVGYENQFAVTRLDSAGGLDGSFAGDGAFGFGFEGGGTSVALDVKIAADGDVVVAGSRALNNRNDAAVARLRTDGTFEDGFDGDGRRLVPDADPSAFDALAIQPDGRILLAGRGGPVVGGRRTGRVVRLKPDGGNDGTFGTGGSVHPAYDYETSAYALALQADGKIVIVGGVGHDGGQIPIVRLQPGGAPDTTFNFDGRATLPFGEFASATEILVQDDGKLLAVGSTGYLYSDIFAVRLQGDGTAAGGTGGPGGPQNGGRPPKCAGKRATIVGTAGRDRLRGTRKADVIVAFGGNDVVKAGRGNDIVCGGAGKDSLAGESGNDRLLGDAGDDRLAGSTGADRLDGGAGNDRLAGDAGKDVLSGGNGKDRLAGGGQADRCVGGGARDRASQCEKRLSL